MNRWRLASTGFDYLVTDETASQAIGRVLVSVADGGPVTSCCRLCRVKIAGGVERTIDLNSGEASIVTDETGEDHSTIACQTAHHVLKTVMRPRLVICDLPYRHGLLRAVYSSLTLR